MGPSPEEEKLRFVAEWKRGEMTMVALCESHGVSRQAGYDLVRRHEAWGPAAVCPRKAAGRCGFFPLSPPLPAC